MATVTCRSPGGPPRRPAWPNPGSRSTAWSAVPAGTSMSSGSVCGVTPRPSHAAHRAAGCRPLPPQVVQVVVNTMWPRAARRLPLPPQATHWAGVPRPSPEPAQVPHAASRLHAMVWRLGATIAASGIGRVTCRSAPRCGHPGALGDCRAPPKRSPKVVLRSAWTPGEKSKPAKPADRGAAGGDSPWS